MVGQQDEEQGRAVALRAAMNLKKRHLEGITSAMSFTNNKLPLTIV